ncbi:MAG: pyridoxal-phosphate dependent enzyme [Lachnospiraceae bacterium]|nr:pyridoxal-phosphate dependent enzyme [Lachnospiraceae bacterium]
MEKSAETKMKKLLILGAGYAQIPLIRAAQRIGACAVTVSIPGPYDGFAYADEILYADISDPDAVLEAARECGADGIATCSLDLGMAAIGKTAEALSLKGPSEAAAKTVSNKYLMKQALQKAGVCTPKFFRIETEEDFFNAKKELQLPVVTKATDLMGSRGIFRCDTFEEAHENYKNSIEASKLPFCLLEEFIDGELFCVEALVEDGRPVFIIPNNTEPFESAVRTSIGHSIPWDHPDLLDQLNRTVTDSIRAVGLDNCPVDMDVILKDGKIYVIEITGRSGATGLAELVSTHFGLDYYEMVARLALGETIRPYFDHPNNDAVIVRTICSDRTGTADRVYYDGSDENVRVEINVSRNGEVRAYTNGRDRVGQVIVRGETPEKCRAALQRALRHTHIDLKGDIPLFVTPIHRIGTDEYENEFFMKREDLLPFSFGGNKVRFAQGYLHDMQAKKCDALVMYGGERSNLCRILSAMCTGRDIPFSRVYNMDDDEPGMPSGFNGELVTSCGGKVYECHKPEISAAVERAMEDFRAEGRNPYYIYGNKFGQGNVHVPMEQYHGVYEDIIRQEEELGISFDQIYLASGTNATHSGILAGQLENGDARQVIGISVTRNAVRAREVILGNLEEYASKKGINYSLSPEASVFITDEYLCGGYGRYNEEITDTIREIYRKYGIPLDPTYTGKAWWGMKKYIEKNGIRGKKILFLHTGGSPLFVDAVCGQRKEER